MGLSEKDQGHTLLLRKRAEEALRGQMVDLDNLETEDIQYLVHELQVHQAELHIQNEELRRVQGELEASRDQYSDLYHFAPSGYCTIDRKDMILEANQTLATLLGVDQKKLVGNHLSHFIAREDQDQFYLYRKRAYDKPQQQVSEIHMVKQNGEKIYVRLESRVAHGHDDQLLVMILDISKQRELQHRLVKQREEERQRIANDLHDGPVQALAALNFALRGIVLDHTDTELNKTVEAIEDGIRAQIQVLRSYAVDLRPPILTQLGLEKGLQSYIERYREKYPGLVVSMDLRPVGPQLSEAAAVALFRICQEALHNIEKHALNTATLVRVKLKKDGSQVRLEITDNGAGFELPDQWLDFAQTGRLGILGMREQAEAVSGQLEIQSTPDLGTTVAATIPLEREKPR